jgi:hypothetical protein
MVMRWRFCLRSPAADSDRVPDTGYRVAVLVFSLRA